MNSKEALERLYLGLEDYDTQAKCYKLILEDLVRLERAEKENQVLLEKVNHFKKAIEILKGFKINLIDFCNGHYSMGISYNNDVLTKEQYELLKEVL